jgi:hypothetical protein
MAESPVVVVSERYSDRDTEEPDLTLTLILSVDF